MNHVNIPILILAIIAIAVCILTFEPEKSSDRIVERTGLSRDLYESLDGLNNEQAITKLSRLKERAVRIVPSFPDFPRIWLTPPANKGIYRSIAERYCLEFLHLLFPSNQFKTVRPNWLQNPRTGRCMELDGYCEDLSLALEYNGIQHYVWPNFITTMTKDDFTEQRYRDQKKAEICTSRNICL